MLFLNEPIQLRCNQTYNEDSYNGSPDQPSNGVKGITLLGEHIKFPEKILIDYMHLVLEGVCKVLLKWFNSKIKVSEYYIGNNFKINNHVEIENIFKKFR